MSDDTEATQDAPTSTLEGLTHNFDAIDKQISEMARREHEATRAIQIRNNFEVAKVVGLYFLAAGIFIILLGLAIRLAFPPRSEISSRDTGAVSGGQVVGDEMRDRCVGASGSRSMQFQQPSIPEGFREQIDELAVSNPQLASYLQTVQFANSEEYLEALKTREIYEASLEKASLAPFDAEMNIMKEENRDLYQAIQKMAVQLSQQEKISGNVERIRSASKAAGGNATLRNIIFFEQVDHNIPGYLLQRRYHYEKSTDTTPIKLSCYASTNSKNGNTYVELASKDKKSKTFFENVSTSKIGLSPVQLKSLQRQCNLENIRL